MRDMRDMRDILCTIFVFLESVTATVNVCYGELSLASDTGSQYYGCADNEAEKLDSHRQPEPPAPAQSYYEDNWSVWTLWPGLRSPTVTLHLQPTQSRGTCLHPPESKLDEL